ncbi:hypothetical protein THAOC_27381, partial [Thalassiosira oceanica]
MARRRSTVDAALEETPERHYPRYKELLLQAAAFFSVDRPLRVGPTHGAEQRSEVSGRGRKDRHRKAGRTGRSMQVGEGSGMNPAAAFAEGGYPAAATADGAATSDDDDGASTASGSSEGNATQEADEDESTADGTREGGPAGGELSHRA